MKRSLCLLLVAAIVLLTGCALPVEGNPRGAEDTSVQGNMVDVEEGDVSDQGKVSYDNKPVEPDEPDEPEKPEKPTMQVNIYYQDADGYIIPVTRRISKQEGIARAAINSLIDNSINREEIDYYGLYPVLPKGTRILGLTIREGTAIIDFSGELLDYDSEKAEKCIISSIVYTLTEFSTVQRVRILVNGSRKDRLKFGTDISEDLDRQNILINSEKINVEQGMAKYDVYLFKAANDRFSYILPVSAEASGIDADAIAARIISDLGKKPAGGVLFSELPEGTELIGSDIKDDMIVLDISKEIMNYGGNAREEGILRQILYSMAQIEGVKKVKILVGGKATNLPEGTDLTESMSIPSVINDYIDK